MSDNEGRLWSMSDEDWQAMDDKAFMVRLSRDLDREYGPIDPGAAMLPMREMLRGGTEGGR